VKLSVVIRDARAEEADTIADLHLKVWTEAYGSFAPAHAVATLNQARRRHQWRDIFDTLPANQFVLVAEAPDRALVGLLFADKRGPEQADGRGWVKLLYVDHAWHGRGVGRCLLAVASRRFEDAGLPGLALGVLVENGPGIRFYERCGGRFVGTYVDPASKVWISTDRVYVWDRVQDFGTGASAQ
jgi:GNAT superfamily N-acetyltransferase